MRLKKPEAFILHGKALILYVNQGYFPFDYLSGLSWELLKRIFLINDGVGDDVEVKQLGD